MVGLAISGLMVIFYRKKIKKTKISTRNNSDEEIEIDQIIDMSESIDNISFENENIHDMVKQINAHLEKCKIAYKNQKKKEDTNEIEKHISTLGTKIQLLVEQIKDFSTMSKDIASNQSFLAETNRSDNRNKNLKS